MPETTALPVAPETTFTVAEPELPDRPLSVSVLVRATPVGAMVVDGRTMPEGPNITVVPSIVVVATVFRAPAPIL